MREILGSVTWLITALTGNIDGIIGISWIWEMG